MAQHPWLDPSPFSFDAGDVGCLLIHGFTGSSAEMRPLGEFLATHGITVSGLLLPGHGTSLDDLIRVRWVDWTAEVERGLDALGRRCRAVTVCGLSMGGLLTLYLGARRDVAGLIPMAAAIETTNHLLPLSAVLKRFLRAVPKKPPTEADYVDAEAFNRCWSYDAYPLAAIHQMWLLTRTVRRELSRITAPILIMQGAKDNMVPPASAHRIYEAVSSPQKDVMIWENSGHVLPVEAEREAVWQATLDFIHRLPGTL